MVAVDDAGKPTTVASRFWGGAVGEMRVGRNVKFAACVCWL